LTTWATYLAEKATLCVSFAGRRIEHDLWNAAVTSSTHSGRSDTAILNVKKLLKPKLENTQCVAVVAFPGELRRSCLQRTFLSNSDSQLQSALVQWRQSASTTSA